MLTVPPGVWPGANLDLNLTGVACSCNTTRHGDKMVQHQAVALCRPAQYICHHKLTSQLAVWMISRRLLPSLSRSTYLKHNPLDAWNTHSASSLVEHNFFNFVITVLWYLSTNSCVLQQIWQMLGLDVWINDNLLVFPWAMYSWTDLTLFPQVDSYQFYAHNKAVCPGCSDLNHTTGCLFSLPPPLNLIKSKALYKF